MSEESDRLPERGIDHSADPQEGRASGATSPVLGAQPIDMILFCPACGLQHLDEPDERTPDWTNPPHRSHLCHGCGHIWRPADVATNGVAYLDTWGRADSPPIRERSTSGWVRAEYVGEVLQNGEWQAGANSESLHDVRREIDHYAAMYGQDGPVEVRLWESGLRPIPSENSLSDRAGHGTASAKADSGTDPEIASLRERVRGLEDALYNMVSLARPYFRDDVQMLALSEARSALAQPSISSLSSGGREDTASRAEGGISPAAPARTETQRSAGKESR